MVRYMEVISHPVRRAELRAVGHVRKPGESWLDVLTHLEPRLYETDDGLIGLADYDAPPEPRRTLADWRRIWREEG